MQSTIATGEINQAVAWLEDYWDHPVYPEYHSAETVDAAVQLLNQYGAGAKILAGGVDLIGLMKRKVITPSPIALINIKSIPELEEIKKTDHGVSIGSLAKIKEIEKSEILIEKYPLLSEAASVVGSPNIRNMGTVAGNIMQDVRCWYYRRPPDTGVNFHCLRKVSDGICYAKDGENQHHAVFCGHECMAPCPSDLAVALTALDATVCTVDSSGGRSLSIPELFTPLGKNLGIDEIITEIRVPDIEKTDRQSFLKFRIRKAIDFAVASAAVVLHMDGDIVSDARIVLGGVDFKPHRAKEAEEYMVGKHITEEVAEKAAQLSLTGASPSEKNVHKVQIAETLVKRAILGLPE
jgi:Aerobic-type carbon monoxide dehydrogenase, middle subunit CoxM/CutM homologs